ncbi:MAG: glycosyltransferase family 1 protein [bacterium]
MNIGIDIRVLARGARTGVEEYTISLLSHLLPIGPDINYQLFYNAYQKVRLDYPWLSLNNVFLRDFKIPNRFLFFSSRYFNQPKIDKILGNVDVYFNPHFFNSPLSKKCRKIITFHDLSFERYPEFFSLRKRLWQKFLMNAREEAKKADKIIAVSHSTKEDLIDIYGIEPEKIDVIYSGISSQFRQIIDNQEETKRIKTKYGLPDDFILYLGTIEPRKNIIGLIKAFELLRNDYSIKLVLAGVSGWLEQDIFKRAKESKYQKDIVFTGLIEPEDRPYIYNLALIFVYPSFFEGFGFPPLEAMACGIPVIVSNSSSLSEAVGDSALMVDPNNTDEIAWAMKITLTDTDLRKVFIKKGLEQVNKFSWQKTAEKTLDIIRTF